MLLRIVAIFLMSAVLPVTGLAQVNEDKLGAWYMYMWSAAMDNSRFGFQGDIQHRNWDIAGDLEQLLIRGGATWSPVNSNTTYTLGYAHITSGVYGPDSSTTKENRLYQEALIPQLLGERIFLTHRLRFEQRDVENQDFRTRFRYFLALNYPINQNTLGEGAVYLSLYNELFLNLERNIGEGRKVDHFDRNRAYVAMGYSLSDTARLQFGYMFQKTSGIGKGQLQFNLIQRF